MPVRLLNVRLDPERLRKVRVLRRRGVVLSDVVREAIDRRFEQIQEPDSRRTPAAVLGAILERYPDPPDLPPRGYDVSNRTAARKAVLEKLTRRRSGR